MKTALVTGCDGFVGRHTVDALLARGYDVTGIDIARSGNRSLDDAMNVFTGGSDHRYELVVHAAAAGPNRVAIDTGHSNFPYNVMLDSAFFSWAIRTRQRHVIYLSSSAAYPTKLQRSLRYPLLLREHMIDEFGAVEPDSVYGWTKLTGERMALAARRCGLSVTVVRPFSGYGEDQSRDFPFGAFVERARSLTRPFTIWGNADQVRDWIHISDVVEGMLTWAEVDRDHGATYPAVNLCTGRGTSMRDLAGMMCEVVGYTPEVAVDQAAPLGVMHRVGDPTRMLEVYTPKVSLEDGVARALRGAL